MKIPDSMKKILLKQLLDHMEKNNISAIVVSQKSGSVNFDEFTEQVVTIPLTHYTELLKQSENEA